MDKKFFFVSARHTCLTIRVVIDAYIGETYEFMHQAPNPL